MIVGQVLAQNFFGKVYVMTGVMNSGLLGEGYVCDPLIKPNLCPSWHFLTCHLPKLSGTGSSTVCHTKPQKPFRNVSRNMTKSPRPFNLLRSQLDQAFIQCNWTEPQPLTINNVPLTGITEESQRSPVQVLTGQSCFGFCVVADLCIHTF